VSRQRLWLVALAAALLIAVAVMLFLKWNSDPAPGEAGGEGSVIGTSGALLLLLLLAGLSARRRKGKGDGENG
jgi:MYXO-CTERM domain-containing protein